MWGRRDDFSSFSALLVFTLDVSLEGRGVGYAPRGRGSEESGVKGVAKGQGCGSLFFFLEMVLFLLHFLMTSKRASERAVLAIRHDVYDYDL
jgi:hypothetical protein